jgi:hypothetical protein
VSFRNFSKKNRPHDWGLLPTVKIAAQNIKLCEFAGGKLKAIFGAWGLQKSMKTRSGNFFSTHRDLSTLKVAEILTRSFLRNAGKGGGPLKKSSWVLIRPPKSTGRAENQRFSAQLSDRYTTSFYAVQSTWKGINKIRKC